MNPTLLPSLTLLAITLCGCAPWYSNRPHKSVTSHAPLPGGRKSEYTTDNDPAFAQMDLRSGDIIFIAIPAIHQIAETTLCRSNHVGIVFWDPAKGWLVAESAVPLSRYTPLKKFLARSDHGWCAIRRLRAGLTDAQITALRTQCDARMGVPYDTGFRYGSRRQFCSKFVYDVYQSALGIHVGELETFSHLLDQNPHADVAFWRVWFFGRIPWNRLTVTPASQFASSLLNTAWQSE